MQLMPIKNYCDVMASTRSLETGKSVLFHVVRLSICLKLTGFAGWRVSCFCHHYYTRSRTVNTNFYNKYEIRQHAYILFYYKLLKFRILPYVLQL
jgi:hypothetical protein